MATDSNAQQDPNQNQPSPDTAGTQPTQSAASAAPAASAAAPVDNSAYVENQGRPQQNPAQPPTKPSLHSAIFDGVLKTFTGGRQPIMVNRTDPATGETSKVQVGRGPSLAQSIIAGALAGMFAPDAANARTPDGRPDPAAAMSSGYAAGQKLMRQPQEQAQAQEDKNLAQKQMVMKANIDLAHLQLQSSAQNHVMLESQIKDNEAGVLKDAADYDKQLSGADANDPTKKAILLSGLDSNELIAQLSSHGWR